MYVINWCPESIKVTTTTKYQNFTMIAYFFDKLLNKMDEKLLTK